MTYIPPLVLIGLLPAAAAINKHVIFKRWFDGNHAFSDEFTKRCGICSEYLDDHAMNCRYCDRSD